MGRVVDLEHRKVEKLAETLLPTLRDRGSLMVKVVDIEDVERWRRAARLAGRKLGWSVRTGVARDGSKVWAGSDDYVVTEADHREAGLRMDELFSARRPPGFTPKDSSSD